MSYSAQIPGRLWLVTNCRQAVPEVHAEPDSSIETPSQQEGQIAAPGKFQIPPDLVVKFQHVDIVDVIL
jgi:hypothetical protein